VKPIITNKTILCIIISKGTKKDMLSIWEPKVKGLEIQSIEPEIKTPSFAGLEIH